MNKYDKAWQEIREYFAKYKEVLRSQGVKETDSLMQNIQCAHKDIEQIMFHVKYDMKTPFRQMFPKEDTGGG